MKSDARDILAKHLFLRDIGEDWRDHYALRWDRKDPSIAFDAVYVDADEIISLIVGGIAMDDVEQYPDLCSREREEAYEPKRYRIVWEDNSATTVECRLMTLRDNQAVFYGPRIDEIIFTANLSHTKKIHPCRSL